MQRAWGHEPSRPATKTGGTMTELTDEQRAEIVRDIISLRVTFGCDYLTFGSFICGVGLAMLQQSGSDRQDIEEIYAKALDQIFSGKNIAER